VARREHDVRRPGHGQHTADVASDLARTGVGQNARARTRAATIGNARNWVRK